MAGNYPGRALSFTFNKKSKEIKVAGFPSKRLGVFLAEGDSLIFRSDSNGEDLEGFAGAGLYDSVCLQSFAVGMCSARRVRCGCVGRAVRQALGVRPRTRACRLATGCTIRHALPQGAVCFDMPCRGLACHIWACLSFCVRAFSG